MRVAVIGAGPSGLVTLKYLKTAHEFFPDMKPIDVKLFESESSIGGTFKYRTYEDAELVSSRQLTTFSDYRYNPEAPDFLSSKEYCTYLEGYAKQFGLTPYIHLSTSVSKVERTQNGHLVQYIKDGEISQWECDAIAVCSGLHVAPSNPPIEGIDNVPVVMHASEFKEKKQFGSQKNILIVGSGETGMDLAHMAVTYDTKSVTLSHRDGFHVAPKRAPDPVLFGMKPSKTPQLNVPYDVGAASLFDTAYVHPLLRDSSLPWAYYDKFAKWTVALVSGTAAGLDQWVGGISPERYHASKIFFNKSTNAMPYISEQYRKNTLLNRIRSSIIQVPLLDTKGRKIDLAPWPKSVGSDGVVEFRDNGREEAAVMKKVVCKPDIVILATGYTQNFWFLDESYPTPKDAGIRRVWKEDDPSVAFIGFVRPSFGAIPPLAELQAQVWVLSLLQKLPAPLKPETHYRLHHPSNSRITYGVDHESYAYQLALDMGSAPSASYIASRGWKLFAVWALSANVNTKFRLVGPWKWSGAERVMKTEIWETVTRRRGFFGHITLSAMPIAIFGTLSALLYLITALWVFAKYLYKVLTLNSDY